MLEAEISNIFALNLVSLAEIAVIFGIITAGVTALFLGLQIKKQSKTTSADISLRMIETIRRDEFREILSKISEGKSNKLSENDIFRVLNHYEYLAEFEKDGVLDFDHVLHQHGRNIKMLHDDQRVKSIFDKSRIENPEYNYTNLDNLFIKIKHSID